MHFMHFDLHLCYNVGANYGMDVEWLCSCMYRQWRMHNNYYYYNYLIL